MTSHWLPPKRTAAAALAVIATGTVPCHAAGVAGFYKGKTIEVFVAAAEGEGYDRYARLLSEFMPGHIPGNPAMTLKFMAGSGGVKAANYVYAVAPKDGTAIACLLSSQPTMEALGGPDIKYKSVNLNWIGRIVDTVSAVIVRRTGTAATLADLKKAELAAGATKAGSVTAVPFAMMNWALGTRFRIVNGYKGVTGSTRAFARGEVQAVAAPWDTILAGRPPSPNQVTIAQVGLEKNAGHPDVPLLIDLVTDPEKKAAVTFLSAQGSIGRTVSAPPRVLEERFLALRKAFNATMKDARFLAAAKQRKMELAPLTGEQVEKLVVEHLATPEGVIRIARKAAGIN